MVMIIIMNLIYKAQFDTNGILTALYIVIKYIKKHHVHSCMDIQKHSYTYTGLHIQTYTNTEGRQLATSTRRLTPGSAKPAKPSTCSNQPGDHLVSAFKPNSGYSKAVLSDPPVWNRVVEDHHHH